VTDGRLDLGHRSGHVHRHDDLLGPEQLQYRPGLGVVVPQAALDRKSGSSLAEDGERQHLRQAGPTGLEALYSSCVVGIWSFQDGWGGAMRQRTFQAAAVAFMLGLLISLAWAFLHPYGF
jgi:hypothetical protein